VTAMRTAAIIQPNAIHKPPKTIHKMLSKSETGDMCGFLLMVLFAVGRLLAT